MIDPRGLDYYGDESHVGDVRYDLAKLSHSIMGLYDHIIAGSYELSFELFKDYGVFDFDIHISESVHDIQKIFTSKLFLGKIKYRDVMPATILLFFSMLPLHSDNPNRQIAFLANAMRLYSLRKFMDK